MNKATAVAEIALLLVLCPVAGTANEAERAAHSAVGNEVIAQQRAALAGVGAGPQSPRDIDSRAGNNLRTFGSAPAREAMNLCNIHFHESAEHRGAEFTTFAGNGDGRGNATGYRYNGTLTNAELTETTSPVGVSEHGDLRPGDTIEIHFVHSTADVAPGATLGACSNAAITNPQLRVETVVAVLVNDPAAIDMTKMASLRHVNGYHQVPNLPQNLGTPVTYAGSTTGPIFNETPSPVQVTWAVHAKVIKLDINSVAAWLGNNPFKENHAHGVRTLITNPDLLSPIN